MTARNLTIGASQQTPRVLPDFVHINRYWDKTREVYTAKILPGEYYVTRANELIITVLGSCVSACIRDTKRGIGGMNHFMLPEQREQVAAGGVDVSLATRYGNVAMEHLINSILKYGGKKDSLEVKIFGGGRILKQATDIGSRNIQFIRDYLRTEGLSVIAEDLGDIYPRKILYDPLSGKVKMKKLRDIHNNTISQRELNYQHTLETLPVESEIDLF